MEFLGAFGSWCAGAGGYGGGAGFHSWMPFHFGGIFQLIIIGLIIYFVARMFRRPVPAQASLSATELLKRRYASGEIDKQTFDRMKQDLD